MSEQKQGCTRQHHYITSADLPLCCPSSDSRLWDAHPRVYLPIDQTGSVTCPYCETEYVLDDTRVS